MQGEQEVITLANPGETWGRNTNCLAEQGKKQFSQLQWNPFTTLIWSCFYGR